MNDEDRTDIRTPEINHRNAAKGIAVVRDKPQPATKPLKWRTDKVSMSLSPGDEVFYEAFIDGTGEWIGVGIGIGNGRIQDGPKTIEHGYYRWLPLSEILELIGE